MKHKELEECRHNTLDSVNEYWGIHIGQILMARVYKCRKCKKIFDIISMHEITEEMIK